MFYPCYNDVLFMWPLKTLL